MTNADNPENTVPTSAFASCTPNDHRRALTVTTDYGTDPNDLQSHEREFLRYRKITADARELSTDPRDLYDMLELDKRTDRILPNGLCLLPPRQACAKGNACLTCDKFATDATFLPKLTAQQQHTAQLIDERQNAFTARTGQRMGEENIWLAGCRQKQDALGRIILKLEQTRLADGPPQAVRRAGVGARTDAITHPGRELTSMRGNPDNLHQAAAQARAETALREMIRRGQPITFRSVAQTADVSLDFLYRCTELRRRVE